MYFINDELKEFIESGVAVAIGTADQSGRPGLTSGWGPRVGADGTTLTVFLETERAAATLANLQETGQIAMVISSPVSYRSLQFKGRWLGKHEATSEDEAWVQRHREAFLTETALVGDPLDVIQNLWMQDVLRIDFSVERAFDQTPGPAAGAQL